ncbi:flippase-like domain-containing protein [bacterium]|nr:flippase-like domain-containing protein [bacterium]MCI0604756.1 flippase-like domain-containing protein [bacterium]
MKVKPFWLKLGAGIALLVLLLTFQVRPSEISREMAESNWRWILLAGALHIIGLLISAYRWQLLLDAQTVEAPIRDLIQSYLIGGFFNNFLPTRVGGDIYRMVDSKKYSGSLLRPFAVIFVERLSGVYALLLIGIAAVAFYPRFQEVKALATALFALAILGFLSMLLFYGSDRFAEWLKRMTAKLPARLSGKMLSMFEAFWYFSRSRGVLIGTFLLALLLQINVILYYYFIARGIQMPVSFQEAAIVMPILICIQLLPLTPNGIGVREFSYIYLLGPFGVSEALAVAFSLWDYILTFFYGLIGGILYLIKK